MDGGWWYGAWRWESLYVCVCEWNEWVEMVANGFRLTVFVLRVIVYSDRSGRPSTHANWRKVRQGLNVGRTNVVQIAADWIDFGAQQLHLAVGRRGGGSTISVVVVHELRGSVVGLYDRWHAFEARNSCGVVQWYRNIVFFFNTAVYCQHTFRFDVLRLQSFRMNTSWMGSLFGNALPLFGLFFDLKLRSNACLQSCS